MDLILAIFTHLDLNLQQKDVKIAFLKDEELAEEIYMVQLISFMTRGYK